MQSENKLDLKYIMFENKSNNCWLDASMALIAHNKAIKKIAKNKPNCKIQEIITTYDEAISILNNSEKNAELRIKTARENLLRIQIDILEYLQPVLNFKNGEPESAFCALLNLIKSIKENLNISWLWKQKCTHCGNSKLTEVVKPIITLSRVNHFEPDCPTSIYLCACKKEQERKLIYKELPECLFFHFENGAGKGKDPPLIFTIQDRKYQLTGVITLEKSLDKSVGHFITWIRDPSTNKWLECNDLNFDIITYSEQPEFNLLDVYLYSFESFDNLGKMCNKVSIDYIQEQDLENTNVELIDLSDSSEDVRDTTVCSSDQSGKNTEESVVSLLKHNSLDLSSQEAAKEKSETKGLGMSAFTGMYRKEHAQMFESEKKESVTKVLDKKDNETGTFYLNSVSVKNLRVVDPLNRMKDNLEIKTGACHSASSSVKTKAFVLKTENIYSIDEVKTAGKEIQSKEDIHNKNGLDDVQEQSSNGNDIIDELNPKQNATFMKQLKINKNNPFDACSNTVLSNDKDNLIIGREDSIQQLIKHKAFSESEIEKIEMCKNGEIELKINKDKNKELPDTSATSSRKSVSTIRNEEGSNYLMANNAIKTIGKGVSQKTSNYKNAPTEENNSVPGTSIEGMDFTSCKASPINKNKSKNKNPVSGKSSKTDEAENKNVDRMLEEIVDSCVDSTMAAFFGLNL